jgi:putative PIN family toxin of toxin-antitoxin system
LSPKRRSRRLRGVVDTSVLLAGVAGFRNAGHNASADFLRRGASDDTFIWLISEEILDEHKEVLARHKVHRELIGRIINLLREEARLVRVRRNERISPDPGDDHFCTCANEGAAGFVVTLNPRDFSRERLRAHVIAPHDSLLH